MLLPPPLSTEAQLLRKKASSMKWVGRMGVDKDAQDGKRDGSDAAILVLLS